MKYREVSRRKYQEREGSGRPFPTAVWLNKPLEQADRGIRTAIVDYQLQYRRTGLACIRVPPRTRCRYCSMYTAKHTGSLVCISISAAGAIFGATAGRGEVV